MAKGALHGIVAMLTGKGEKKNREARRKFDDAIPETGTDNHPAVSGPLANSASAFNYRRANANHGPKSQAWHRRFATIQAARAEYERQVRNVNAKDRVKFEEWLRAMEG